MNEKFDHLFKVVLIGDSSVGKSSILARFSGKEFSITGCKTTVGVDFVLETFNIQNKRIKLQLWDTAGQERFKCIASTLFRSANAVIIVYDITNRSSYLSIQNWINEMEKYADDKIVCALVGNKCDLEGERKTRFTEAEMFCSLTPEIFLHFETSAKDNTNIAQLFAKIVTVLMNRQQVNSIMSDSIQLRPTRPNDSRYCNC